jgi:hypothetical protein
MKKARIAVLVLTVAVPGLLWLVLYILCLPDLSEVQSGTSRVYQRSLANRLFVWSYETRRLHFKEEQDRVSSFDPDKFIAAFEKAKLDAEEDAEKVKRMIEQDWNNVPPEVQALVVQSKQQANEKLLADYRTEGWNILLSIGAPLIGLGMVAVWVMSPGQVRQRLHEAAKAAFAGLNTFAVTLVVLGLALDDVELFTTKEITLWFAGGVASLMVLYWTRGPRQLPPRLPPVVVHPSGITEP